MQTRRLSAVWFADIVGFTAYASQNEDAAVAHVQVFQDLSHRLIEGEHRGRCVKFIGDAVLAEFPSADAAVRAAIALRNAFAAYCREAAFDSSLRIGVHIGEVLSMPDGDIYGDGVNTASRLQKEAAPGQVLISEDVWRQLRQRPEFRFDSLGELELRGITARIAVFNVGLGGAPIAPAEPAVVEAPPKLVLPRKTRGPLTPILLAAAGVGGVVFAVWQSAVKGASEPLPATPTKVDTVVLERAANPLQQQAAARPEPEPETPRAPPRATQSITKSGPSSAVQAPPQAGAPPPTLVKAQDTAAVQPAEPDLADREGLERHFAAMLTTFAQGVGQRDLSKIAAVYPGFTEAELYALYPSGAGGSLAGSAERARLMRVDAASATVNFLLVFAGVDTRPFRARFERGSRGWKIVQLNSLL